MSELKLTQHPEITGRLSVLEQNGLHKEQNEVKCLAAYIDEMAVSFASASVLSLAVIFS